MQADRPLPLPRAIWGATLDEFVGPRIVSPVFAIDGRDGDYDVFWEAPWLIEPAWRSQDGRYAIHLVDDEDWSPPTAILLAGAKKKPVGFYAGGEIWIDKAHRGRGMSVPLIACLVQALGRSAYDNKKGLGFSPAGYAAHAAAHRMIVGMAMEAGMRVPKKVRDAVEVPTLSGPKP